jgi:hypothetical protein
MAIEYNISCEGVLRLIIKKNKYTKESKWKINNNVCRGKNFRSW